MLFFMKFFKFLVNLYIFINIFYSNNIFSCKCYFDCKKNNNNINNDEINTDNEDDKKIKKENDNNLQKLFNECIIKNLPELPNKYKPINAGFEWKKNWCWLISIIELYLNRPYFQDFLRNTNFDENNDDDKKYIVLKNILQLLLNNEGNYNLNFDNYYEYFWYELEKKTNILLDGKKYCFNVEHHFLNLVEKFSVYIINESKICKEIEKYSINDENTKILNKFALDFLKNESLFTYILKQVLKDKVDNFINKSKDNLIEIVDYITENETHKEYSFNDPFSFYYEKDLHENICFIYLDYSSQNVKNEIEEIKKKEEDGEIININDEMKNYDIKINSILFNAFLYHKFTFVHDINNDKWINLNSLNKDENGKIYNPIDRLNDNLELTQQNDSHKYFPYRISITISKKS